MDPIEALFRAAQQPDDDAHGFRNTKTSGIELPAFLRERRKAAPDAPVGRTGDHLNVAMMASDLDPEEKQLDEFDKELLAEPTIDRQWQASQRPARVSLPPKSFRTPTMGTSSTYFAHGPRKSTPVVEGSSSPSPLGIDSSPSMNIGRQRRSETLHRTSEEPTGSQKVTKPSSTFISERDARPRQSDGGPSATAAIDLGHAPPIVQGIRLVPAVTLPDRFRSLFPYPMFNAVQSKCFEIAYRTDENLVVSAPTGSGKTVVMELAICALIRLQRNNQFKIVYQAPTKSLCAERYRDWQRKFSALDLQCAELTGDTDYSQLKSVQSASIIITTPEKWDSVTRKWKDHIKLMRLVKLFLIDEVHMLREPRGAVLEAVVSRMKSIGSSVRFIALSATVPNSEDVASWLGRSATSQHLPAHREVFGENFRPVALEKFVYGYAGKGNEFFFDKMLDAKLPDVIAKHSNRKPIMVFCFTRKSAIETAKNLATLWFTTNPSHRLWPAPRQSPEVQNLDLRATVSRGVAFHHAGLDVADRNAVEQSFLNGQSSIICCTSTLAVGVNLPCHLVIIKNTVAYSDGGFHEYSDLEIMQMLGRAGRPQYDDSAVAVVLTREERAPYYERMVSGQDCLESCLHLNLIDHLNAEIGLGTVTSRESAKRWLSGTFLFVRLSKNPRHYRLDQSIGYCSEEGVLDEICEKDIRLLQENSLILPDAVLKSTEFGDAMARYYVNFETMTAILSLPPRAKMSEILSGVAQAEEFRDIRFRSGEKSLYKEINKDIGIKFPIKVDLALPAHKASLLIQAELGAVEFPTKEQHAKHKVQFQQDKVAIFQHLNRLIRCLIDCQIHRQDSVSVRNALELARSFGARVWDNSPLQITQIDQIGAIGVRKLANAGINSLEALEATEPHRIEMVMGRNPPFGAKLLERLAAFPKPRVTVKMMGKETRPGKSVSIKLKAEVGFLNEIVPTFFRRRPIYVCLLVETSDGRLVEFRRISATQLQSGHDVLLSVDLLNSKQTVLCYAMCDEIAGTLQYAELRPELPPSLFSRPSVEAAGDSQKNRIRGPSLDGPKNTKSASHHEPAGLDEFSESALDDGDLLSAEMDNYISVDELEERAHPEVPSPASNNVHKSGKGVKTDEYPKGPWEPVQLDNGKWACNHKCKDKVKCKHLCCRDGLDKPKAPKASQKQSASSEHAKVIASLEISKSKPNSKAMQKNVHHKKHQAEKNKVVKQLDLLHANSTKQSPKQTLPHGSPTHDFKKKTQLELPFLKSPDSAHDRHMTPSEFDVDWMEDMPSPSTLLQRANVRIIPAKSEGSGDHPELSDEHEESWLHYLRSDTSSQRRTTRRQDEVQRSRGSSSSSTWHNTTPKAEYGISGEDDDFDFVLPDMDRTDIVGPVTPGPNLPLADHSNGDPDSSMFVSMKSSTPEKIDIRPKWLTNMARKRSPECDSGDTAARPNKQNKGNNGTSVPLHEVQNVGGETNAKKEEAARAEENENPWAGLDPEIWAEYKDLVEFV